MEEKEMDQDSSLDRMYMDSVRKIMSAVGQGLSFDQACSTMDMDDKELREAIIDDALKVLIAEMHFSKGMPLKELAVKLSVSLSRIMNAKESMLIEVGEASIAEYRAGHA
ncbi:MAG: hypothetical protein OHK0032_05300 [Thermodesulfovibrionales bacterium]